MAKHYAVRTVYDLLDCQHEQRMEALRGAGVSAQNINAVAMAANAYPDVELHHEVLRGDDGNITLSVTVEADAEDPDDDDEEGGGAAADVDKSKVKCPVPAVVCPLYPLQKKQAWFLMVGHEQSNDLLFIKRFTMNALQKKFKIPLRPKQGADTLKLYLMSDSYLGCDQYVDIEIQQNKY